MQIVTAVEKVYQADETIVEGLCNWNGIRYDSTGTSQHGGKRIKSEVISADTWLKPLAKTVVDERKENIISKYVASFEGLVVNDDDSDIDESSLILEI